MRTAQRTCEACANTCPPTAFLGSAPAKLMPLGSACTWLVYTTATLNSSASLLSIARNCPSFCCRSLSSPRPTKSTRKCAITLSTINSLNGASAIFAASATTAFFIISDVNVRATRMLSNTHRGSKLNRSAICTMRFAVNVPSVSIHATLAKPPPSLSSS